MTDKHEPIRQRVLERALALTVGDRNRAYGDPLDNFNHIAKIYAAITKEEADASSVVLAMIATKLARYAANPLGPAAEDSIVDLCAYVAILYEIRERQAEEAPGHE